MHKFSSFMFAFLVAAAAHADTGGPWLGLELGPAPRGVAVRAVVDGSPAARAHIEAGEAVIAFDGEPVATAQGLVDAVIKQSVGAKVPVTVTGKHGQRTVEVVLSPRPREDEMQRMALLDKTAPDFKAAVAAGGKLDKLSSLRGQVVLLDFFATWCGPCRLAMPHLEALHKKLGGKGLRVVGISGEAHEVVADAAGRFHLSYTLVADSDEEIAAQYHVYALPTAVVIDRRGKVHAVSVSDMEETERVVLELLGEKADK